jgi:alkaline phosphatase D
MPTLSRMDLVYTSIIAFWALLGTSVTHGPIISDLTQDSVCIWVKTEEPKRVAINPITPDGKTPRHYTILTRANKDNTHYVKITNLKPNTRYSYTVDGKFDDAWWFTTRPIKDDACRIAFGSCANELRGSSTVWNRINEDKETALVLLGDTPYIDTTNLTVQRARYRIFAAVPAFAKLVSHTPLYSMWDDHDFGRNDTDGNLEGKENSRQAFKEYRLNPSFGEHGQGIYTSFKQGPVEVFLLDARWFAGTEEENGNPTLLGKQQWQWLERSLAASTAPYKVLACGMVFNESVRPLKTDYWGGYPTEYERLLKLIAKTKATGVILVSGDIHWSRLFRHDTKEAIGYDLHEFVTSPIHERLIIAANPPHENLLFSAGEPNSFLLLETSLVDEHHVLTMTFRNAKGDSLYEHRFAAPPSLD